MLARWWRTLRSRVNAGVSSQAERLAEDLAHDLVGAAADRAEPQVAYRALDPRIRPVDVEARVGGVVRRPLRRELRHRHLLHGVHAGEVHAQRVVRDRATA